MRAAIISCIFLGFGVLAAQQPPAFLSVRSINFKLISTTHKGLEPVSPDLIAATLKSKRINLAIAGRFDPAAVDKAAEAIRERYRQEGHNVRVEHSAKQISPGGVEVAFEVIELCSCN